MLNYKFVKQVSYIYFPKIDKFDFSFSDSGSFFFSFLRSDDIVVVNYFLLNCGWHFLLFVRFWQKCSDIFEMLTILIVHLIYVRNSHSTFNI